MTTLSLIVWAISALLVILAGVHVYRTHDRLAEIRDILIDIRDEFK